MTHAELLRSHANLAIKEGGMYYSGEYLSGIATVAESLEAENAKLRELVRHLYEYRQSYFKTGIYPTDHGVTEQRMRELGVEVTE